MEQLKHRDSDSFLGCNMSCLYQILHHITKSLLVSWCNIIFAFSLSYLNRWASNAPSLVADDAFTGFSYNDRRRCR